MKCTIVPALLDGIANPIKRCLTPGNRFGLHNGHDPAWFTDLSYFLHPYFLISYYYAKKTKDYRKTLRVREDVKLFADSGGYSIMTQGKKVDTKAVLEWQEHNANVAFSLDFPPLNSEGVTRVSPGTRAYKSMDEYERYAAMSRQNNLDFQTLRTSNKLQIYNVIHGYNAKTFQAWWDYVTPDINFEGYATSMKIAVSPIEQAMGLMFLYDKGVRKNAHLLGVAGITIIPVLVWISQYIDNITFDSSSYGYGARTRAYVYPDRIRYYTHFGTKFAGKKKPMTKLYCKCPICSELDSPDYFLQNKVTWPGLLISLHNLWCVKEYVSELNRVLHDEKDEEKFFALVKQHTGNAYESILHAINFVEDCRTKGFKTTYDIYFQDSDLEKKKFTTRKLC